MSQKPNIGVVSKKELPKVPVDVLIDDVIKRADLFHIKLGD